MEDTGEIKLEDLVQMEGRCRHCDARRIPEADRRRHLPPPDQGAGRGRIGMSTRAEDVVEHLIVASTHAYLLIFTNKGRVYWLKIYNIPDAVTTGEGQTRLRSDGPAAG